VLDDKALKELQIRFCELNIPAQQSVDSLRTQRKCRDALVQLADGDGGVIADFGDALNEVFITAGRRASRLC
jgi:hypothetical protein